MGKGLISFDTITNISRQSILKVITHNHRLNMKLDLQSLFGLLCTAVLIGWDPTTSPPLPAFGLIYEGAIGQPKETTSLCNPLLIIFSLKLAIMLISMICIFYGFNYPNQGVTMRCRLSWQTPSYMSPNARGEGGGELRGLGHWVQLCTVHTEPK